MYLADLDFYLNHHRERKDWLKFPTNAEEVQHLSMVLSDYVKDHYSPVLFCFVATYLA